MAPKDDTVYRPRFVRLEERLLLNATPEAAVADLPDEDFINEDFEFSVTFDNTSTDPTDIGFGPFVDVTVGPGIDVTGVSFLGTTVAFDEIGVWDGVNWIDANGAPVTEHPLDDTGVLDIPVGLEIGETWLNIQAPFGSYTPDQPVIDLDFTAQLNQSPDGIQPGAEPGSPIQVTARGGFRFGADGLDNPSIDPPIQQANTATDDITPIVLRLQKSVDLPEGETAQGENFPFTYTISVDIANGIALSDIQVTDALPQNLFFLDTTSNITPDVISAPNDGTNPQGVPVRDTVEFAEFLFADTSLDPNASIVGTTAEDDILITLTAFAPETGANDALIIDPDNPQPAIATNSGSVTANFEGQPLDPSSSGATSDSVDITIRPFTVLKSVEVEGGGPAVPGEFLKFTIDIDVSDYQGFQDLVLRDTLSDGLTLDTTDNNVLEHTPVLTGVQNGVPIFIEFEQGFQIGNEQELDTDFPGDGTQDLTFFVSNTLRNNGGDGSVSGDLFLDNMLEGATELQLTYFALIEEDFRATGLPVVSNDALTNTVSLEANSQSNPANPAAPDGSGSEVSVAPPSAQKSVFAVNGQTPSTQEIAPGDLVTYRLRLDFASLDTNNLVIRDFLPEPVYDADATGGFSFVDTQGGLPAAYQIIRGPDDTVSGASNVAGIPVVATDGDSNSFTLSFGDFDEVASQGGVIDLLYTVPVEDRPFADGLLLVNQALVTTGSSSVSVANTDTILGEIVLRQPVLELTKGVVATDADGGPNDPVTFTPTETGPTGLTFQVGTEGFTGTVTSDELADLPITSDLSGFDAGDTVKFAITLVNVGGQDAFDITISDIAPPGFVVPTDPAIFDLDVRFGDGTEILPSASAASGSFSFSGDLFNTPLEINDIAGTGSLGPDGGPDGSNVIIITYDLVVGDTFTPETTVDNEATLTNFASIEQGNNFTTGVDGQFTDEVFLTSQGLDLDKRLVTTDQSFTNGDDLAIGEIATFQLEITMPDGRSGSVGNEAGATIVDLLPEGLEIVGDPILLTTFTDSGGNTQTFAGSLSQGAGAIASGSALAFTLNGNDITIEFDEILTTAGAGTGPTGQLFAIQYQVQAIDDPVLGAGDQITNQANIDTPTTAPTDDAQVRVDIVEPDLSITKLFSQDTVEGGDVLDLTLEVENATGTFVTTSFGLELTDDDLPKDVFSSVVFDSVVGTGSVDTSKLTIDVDATSDPNLFIITVTGDDDFAIAPGEKLTLSFTLTVQTNVSLGTALVNTATIDSYTSLPGTPAVERTFGPESDSDTLTIDAPGTQKILIDTSFKGGALIDPDPNVFVGEILTYEVSVRFPIGVIDQAVFFDDTELLGVGVGTVEILGIVPGTFFVGGGLDLPNFNDLNNDGLLTAADAIISDTTGNGLINRVEFQLGTVDADPTRDVLPGLLSTTIAYTLQVQVVNAAPSVDGTVQTNLARTEGFGGGSVIRDDATVDITINEPAVDLTKSILSVDSTPDAGDVVTYSLTVSHGVDGIASNAPAFDLVIEDQLPAELELLDNPGPNGSTVTITPINVQGFQPLDLSNVSITSGDGGQIVISGFDLPLGQTATITYQAVIGDGVIAGQALENDARLTYASLPSTDAGAGERRDGSDIQFGNAVEDPSPRSDTTILNNYGDVARETVTITTPDGITKVSDRETVSVTAPGYTIGEQIIYTITVPIIEGVTENAVLLDELPVGIVFVETGADVADSITVTDGTGSTVTVQSAQIVPVGQSQRLEVVLGDIQNPGNNVTTDDFLTFQFTAQVANVLVNDNGDQPENSATFQSTDQPDRTDTATITIIEPEIEIDKAASPTGPFDAADLIEYTVTISHASTSTSGAFEFEFADTLPGEVDFVQIVSASVDNTSVLGQVEFDATSGTIRSISGANIDIPLGSQLVIVYQTQVRDDITPGAQISNSVQGFWTSLDGNNADTGTILGERSGSLAQDVNDYVAFADLDLDVDTTFSIAKSVDGPTTDFAVGETVTYFLDITVFEGVTNNIRITDSVDPGVAIDINSLRVVAGDFNGAAVTIENATLSNPSGDELLEFNLDNTPGDGNVQLINPGDPIGNTDDNDTIRVAYEALVQNVLGNQDQVVIDNVATGSGDGTENGLANAEITLVEPDILLEKVVTSPAGSVDAGDVISYSVTLENTGTSEAFDVVFTDQAPTNAVFEAGSVQVTRSSGVTFAGTTAFSNGDTVLTIDAFDLAVGETLTVTYQIIVQDTIVPGNQLTNAADVRWTSTSGANDDERDGSDTPPSSDDTILNNYAAQDSVTVDTDFVIDIAKSLIDSSQDNDASTDVLVGETLTWQLELTLTEGTTPNVVITDQLAADMIFTGNVTVTPPNGVSITFTDPNPVSVDPNTNLVTINLGDVTVEGSDAGAGVDTQILTLTYQTIVANTPGNQSGTTLPNTASVTATDGLAADDAAGVTVIEPDLEISKTNNATGDVQAGDTVRFTIEISHSALSEATAFDLVFSDPVDADAFVISNFDTADLSGTDVSGLFQIVGNTLQTVAPASLDLAVGEVLTLSYEAVVQDTIGPNETLTNTATASWTSLDGAVNSGLENGERDGSDGAAGLNDYVISDTSDVLTDDILQIVKEITPKQTFTIGETVTYQFDVTVLQGTLLEVTLSDLIDQGVAVDPLSLTVVNNGFAGLPVTITDVDLQGDPATGPTTLSFKLDNDLTNAGAQLINPGDTDATNDTIRITFTGTVLNILENQDGLDLADTVTVTATNATQDQDTANLTLVEPDVGMILSAQTQTPTVDAGDVVSVTAVLAGTGNATAFDSTFFSAAPTDTLFTGVITASDSSGNAVGTFSIAPDGTFVSGSNLDIPIGETVTINYEFTIQDSFSANTNIELSSSIEWTSISGTAAQERTGADGEGPDDQVLNNYRNVQILANTSSSGDGILGLDKTVDATSVTQTQGTDVAVGEIVTYLVRTEVFEGTTTGFILLDDLAPGTRFIDGSVTVTADNPSVTFTFDQNTDVEVLPNNLLRVFVGDFVNPGDNIDANNFINVSYQVMVEDDPALVVDGNTLINTASVFANISDFDTDSAQVDVVEPDLTITKTIPAGPLLPVGQDVDYQVVVEHSGASNASAFDLIINDLFDQNPGVADLDTTSVTARIENATGVAAPVVQIVGGGFQVLADELPQGAQLIIEYTANTQVFTSVIGTLVDNTATLDYDTIPAAQAPDEQRSYDDQDIAVGVIVGPDLELVKDAAVGVIEPGQSFDYTITVTNIGVPLLDLGAIETATSVVLRDILPPDLTLLAADIDGTPVTPSFVGGDRAFTIDLGDLAADEVRTITLTVEVADPASAIVPGLALPAPEVLPTDPDELVQRIGELNQELRSVIPPPIGQEPSSNSLNNVAAVSFDQTDPTPLNNIDNAVVTLDAVPDLVVTKTNDVAQTGGSEVVPFTITVSNQGDRIAADVLIVDQVDTTVFEFVSADNGGVFDPDQSTVTWIIDRLSPEDGSIDLGLVLQVKPALSSTITETTNFVEVSDNGLGGDDPTPENNSDSHTDTLIYPDLLVTKSNAVEDVSPGDIITFTITAQNIGDFVADGVVVTDLVDTNVFTFVSATNGGVFDDATETVTWSLGTLEAGAAPIVLEVTLEVVFPDVETEIAVNTVLINSDLTRGRETDLTNNIDVEIDVLNAFPDPSEVEAIFLEDEEDEEEELVEPVLISPFVSGVAPAGATVTVHLIGAGGAVIQSTTTLASDDGSWFLTFEDVDADEQPVSAIVVTAPSPVTARDGLASNNVTFSPGGDTPITFAREFEMFSEKDLNSAELLQAEIEASERPGTIGARRFVNFDEASGPSINLQ
ncbi:MAG: hypothetical protein AAGC81_03350 [Pseudomonadota bacterium]